MIKIPLHIAEKLLLLQQGEFITASSVKHAVVELLIEENIVFTIGPGTYTPEQIGVRIEVTLIVRTNGAEIMG